MIRFRHDFQKLILLQDLRDKELQKNPDIFILVYYL